MMDASLLHANPYAFLYFVIEAGDDKAVNSSEITCDIEEEEM